MSNLSELLPTGGGQNAVDFVAAENISAGQAVALKTDGQIEAADSANLENVIGLAAEAITSGNTGAVNVFGGINEAQSGLTVGSTYYVNSSGSLTTSSSGPSIKLGQAITATTINLLDYPSLYAPASFTTAYTSPGTYSYIAPAGYTTLSVIVIGGGGSGGLGGGGTGGGGGGGYAKSVSYPVNAGSSYSVVVGAGGNEGVSTWYIGTGGGASSFDSALVANGGAGAGNAGSRQAGGTASGGDSLNLTGGYGGASTEAGGAGPTGGGGGYTSSSAFYVGGTANQLYGGNGGDAVTTSAGQNGYAAGGGGAGGFGRYITIPSSNCLGADGAVYVYFT